MTDSIWIWFAENGNIRKWQREPFQEGTEYVLASELSNLNQEVEKLREALRLMLNEHDVLSGNFGDVMDPKHTRPDRWPTSAAKARAALGGSQ